MTPATLTKELIEDTAGMRLILQLGARRLTALICGPEGPDRTLLVHSEALADNSVKALENAIYDNPLLLSDFDATDIILTGRELFTAPAGLDELHESMADVMLPDYEGPRTVLREGAAINIDICYVVDSEVFNFLKRTFACARFHHCVAVVAPQLASVAAGRLALCAMVDEDDGAMTLIAFNADGVATLLTRHESLSASDCAYHILAALPAGAEVLLYAGDEMREEIDAMVRRVVPDIKILPISFPENVVSLRVKVPAAPLEMLFISQQ